jgi:hypothetical protein
MPASRVGVTPAGFELLLVQYYRSVRSQRSHLLTMSLLSGCDGGTNRPFLQNPCRRRSFKQRRFCVTDPLDCTFPWYYTCLQSQSGASPDNRPLVASMVVQIIYSCRNPYRRRSGLLFLDSRISHQSELSSKSFSFSAVVQNTRRLSLLRKLGDRLDLDIHLYQINAPISYRLIWLCVLLYPSLATSAA